jgi:tetratricopeptide (TPR) repeat protein
LDIPFDFKNKKHKQMKRTVSLLLFCLLLSGSFAQKPTLIKAYNAYYEKNYVKAKEVIDQCLVDEKLNGKAQTWLYKANIDFYLANEEYGKKQENNQYTVLYPSSPEEAYDAFNKALALNKNIEASDMFSPFEGKSRLYSLLLIYGVEKMLKNEFEDAVRILTKSVESYEMKTPEYKLKGELYYYYAYALEMSGKEDESIEYYHKAIQDGSTSTNIYVHLIEHYKKTNDEKKVLELIQTGKNTLTDLSNILVAEIDYHWDKEREKGMALLQALPASAYTNSDAVVNIANLYIKNDDYPKAIELLKKANQMSPNTFVILYNLGYCTLKLYEQKFLESNRLAVQRNKDQAEILNKEADVLLQEAELNFEKALFQEPNDLSILEQLKEIYARKQSPKYDEIIKKIESLKK